MTPEERLSHLEAIVARLVVSDRYTIQKHLQMFDGRNIQTGRTAGTKIGTAADQKLGFFGTTPVIQPAHTTTAAGIVAALTALGIIAP
jgi:hypothetical protein